MTEVAGIMPPDHRIATVRHYEAAPPLGMELVEPGETIATTKEEEWVSKKKTEVTNTKQIETRVKRQVVLEDGKVVEDSGPMVTTNTTEDTETQEHHHTELRKLEPDELDSSVLDALEDEPDGTTLAKRSNAVQVVANPDGIVREVKERRVVSREETEEVKETEDVQHLGDITDEEFLAAVRSGTQDLRPVLRSSEVGGRTIVSTGPRVVRDTQKSNKVVDTEDTRELSCVRPDGKIVTETQRTTEHEETKDEELSDGEPDLNLHKESSERYLKTREQEDVDYVENGVNVGHEMRFKTETMEVERRGDGVDEPDVFDSLSARARRRAANRQTPRYRGIENGIPASPLDRKDALTRRPLDFDQEEETRKVETSKWLENHFGSDSKSSNNSIIDDEEERAPPKTSFFNVTIKSQPSVEAVPQNTYSARVYPPVEAEMERDHPGVFYKGISEWSERRHDNRYASDRMSPSPSPYRHHPHYASDHHPPPRHSPSPDYRYSPASPRHSPLPDYHGVRHSPSPDYRHSPTPDYGRSMSPRKEVIAPTPPQRKKSERHRQRAVEERSRYDSGYRSSRTEDYRDMRDQKMERLEEPPPDYSPPSPPPMPIDKKLTQKTRFAVDATPTKPHKSGNIIGQSIRKLVGKIRSASAERKARQQRAKRSPSPSYQPGHVIDSNIGNNGSTNGHSNDRPVQRYYLGEDPFAGSIYGRENKYDGVVRPTRSSKRHTNGSTPGDERRSQSTLGRFSKSTGRLVNSSVVDNRSSQTLPRHLHKQSDSPSKLGTRSNSTINISIINTPRKLEGPAKPARTYKSSLSRSKSFSVQAGLEPQRNNMYTSNPHLNKLEDSGIGLKSPGLISSLNRSHKDVNGDDIYTSRFARNGTSDYVDSKRGFLSSFREKTPEYWKPSTYSTPVRNGTGYTNGNIYEPPTRLRDSLSPSQSIVRRGSSSSTDFSETYHTTTRNDDPVRPSTTDTTKSFSKKIIPSKDGKSIETIQSSELKSVTKSHYRGSTPTRTFYEERRYNSGTTNPVVIEVRNYRK